MVRTTSSVRSSTYSYAIDRAIWARRRRLPRHQRAPAHAQRRLLFYLSLRLAGTGGGVCRRGLFGVHPMMTEAVGYISGRSELLARLFLAAILCGRAGCAATARGGALSIACWARARREGNRGDVPFTLWPRLVRREGSPQARRRRLMTVHAPLIGVTIVAGVARLALLALVEYPGQVAVHWRYVLLELDVVRRYLWLMVNPSGQTIFHSVAPVGGLLEARALAAIAAVGVVILGGCGCGGPSGRPASGILVSSAAGAVIGAGGTRPG